MLKFILICLSSILLLTGCSVSEKTENKDNQLSGASKTSTNETIPSSHENSLINNTNTQSTTSASIETEIATFSTKIMVKEEGRQHNLHLTCNSLNGTRIEPR